jgi:Rieske Fe-S protein
METAQSLSTNPFVGNRQIRTCEICGNEYDKCFEVRMNDGTTHVFDSFECAIHALAPRCSHCGCAIIGHGMESNGVFYCCAHCANQEGVHDVEDRAMSDMERRPS